MRLVIFGAFCYKDCFGKVPKRRPDPRVLRKMSFGRERGDDFLEARVVAQRVPVQVQTQPTTVY